MQKRFAFALIVLVAAAFGPGPNLGSAAGRTEQRLEQLQSRHKELHAAFAAKLEEIASYCDEKGFAEPAADIRSRAISLETDVVESQDLPTAVQPDIPK